jgi:hypothetical protein
VSDAGEAAFRKDP